MNFKLNFFRIATSLIIVAYFSSCGCDTECLPNQIVDEDCNCVTVNCDGFECDPGFLLDADCNCIPDNTEDCPGVTCPSGQTLNPTNCACEGPITISSNISSDETWTTGNTYILAGRIAIEAGVTLTIEPGVVVKGESGTMTNATALLVARDATLNACGTASLPIVFTSVSDNLTPAMVAAGNYSSPNLPPDVNGLWGGVIVLGNAPISAQNANEQNAAELQIEGIPTTDTNGLYGGDDPADSSGNLCYISIRHGGTNIGGGNEINGLTLGGVGSGTSIDNIEVVANQDDGIEWFGGTVSVSNALVWNCGDDGLDTDQAWNGTCDNWVVALPSGGSGMELDGPEGDLTQGCNSFNNGTIFLGNGADHIIDWDDNTNTGITNLYIFGIDASYDPTVGIETFGGDGTCTTGTWEYTVPAGYDAATMFAGAIGAGQATEVSENANTVGADTSGFGWTFGAHSGTLASIGL